MHSIKLRNSILQSTENVAQKLLTSYRYIQLSVTFYCLGPYLCLITCETCTNYFTSNSDYIRYCLHIGSVIQKSHC